MFRKKDYIISESGISKIEKVKLGGVEQSILLQGENMNNPILLFLHGGPSMPLPGVSSKGQDYTIITNTKQLVKHFVIVFWDQRGTGQSYHPHLEKINVSDFISDAKELVHYLCKTFNKPKLFLAGHSWGSIIGLQLAYDIPNYIYSYVGFSQIINWVENDKLALEWTINKARSKKNIKALKELEAIGNPPFIESIEQWGTLRKWQASYNSLVFKNKQSKHSIYLSMMKGLLTSETYSIKDIINSFVHGAKLVYHQQFIKDISKINFFEYDKNVSLDIPVLFIHGVKDVHVFGEIVETFLREARTKDKQLIWATNSGHAFHKNDTKINEELLISQLKYLN